MTSLTQVDKPTLGANVKAMLMQEWRHGKVVAKNLDGSVVVDFVGMGRQDLNPRDTTLYKSSYKEHEKALDTFYKNQVTGGNPSFSRR